MFNKDKVQKANGVLYFTVVHQILDNVRIQEGTNVYYEEQVVKELLLRKSLKIPLINSLQEYVTPNNEVCLKRCLLFEHGVSDPFVINHTILEVDQELIKTNVIGYGSKF